MMGGYYMMSGMGWLGILTMLLFWIGVIALVVWGASNLFPTHLAHYELDALEIVKQRFARGEISREEYEHARAALR